MNERPGKRLRFIRSYLAEKLGVEELTTYEMADITEVSQSTYSRYETGVHPIAVDLLITLYKKFKILPHFICTGILPIEENEGDKTMNELSEMKAEILALKASVTMLLNNRKNRIVKTNKSVENTVVKPVVKDENI